MGRKQKSAALDIDGLERNKLRIALSSWLLIQPHHSATSNCEDFIRNYILPRTLV